VGRTLAFIGDKCERDIDCIENAFCRWQEACNCDPFYSPSLDRSKCIASKFTIIICFPSER